MLREASIVQDWINEGIKKGIEMGIEKAGRLRKKSKLYRKPS